MCDIEAKNAYHNFSKTKYMFDFSNYSSESKYYDDSNAVVVGKMKDEMGGIAFENCFGLKPKI